jgi:hypothetical protein
MKSTAEVVLIKLRNNYTCADCGLVLSKAFENLRKMLIVFIRYTTYIFFLGT